jgi:hypothetical protein
MHCTTQQVTTQLAFFALKRIEVGTGGCVALVGPRRRRLPRGGVRRRGGRRGEVHLLQHQDDRHRHRTLPAGPVHRENGTDVSIERTTTTHFALAVHRRCLTCTSCMC